MKLPGKERNKVLKAGTILVPKPDKAHLYKGTDWENGYIVSTEDEAKNSTIGDYWMIKSEPDPEISKK